MVSVKAESSFLYSQHAPGRLGQIASSPPTRLKVRHVLLVYAGTWLICSTGSPSAVDKLLSSLPKSLDALQIDYNADRERPPESPTSARTTNKRDADGVRDAAFRLRMPGAFGSSLGDLVTQLTQIDLTAD